MTRIDIINTIGNEYHKHNVETGEYSYVKAIGNRKKLEKLLGHSVVHFKLDIRFEKEDVVVLVETKQNFGDIDKEQLAAYLEEERALNPGKKIICILANTNDNRIKVWKSAIDDEHLLVDETIIDTMQHYEDLFRIPIENNREEVLKNTYDLNELLHKRGIKEHLRSQFVGTSLLYIKNKIEQLRPAEINEELQRQLDGIWNPWSPELIRTDIGGTLQNLLNGVENMVEKINLLKSNVLGNSDVKKLKTTDWKEILDFILLKIYRYIDPDSPEGQDILNLFFIAFNKYTGRDDKNQAFTPDHITDFMCQITDVSREKVVLDPTCGSGSFLVQAMVKELKDCRRGTINARAVQLMESVKKEHIYGIEIEEKAFGLSTTNMLIHGDGNSNIIKRNCFDCKDFIKNANPDIILMNPPYNDRPDIIPNSYKRNWGRAVDGKEEPTKGLVFVQFLSDVIKEMNEENGKNRSAHKEVKLATLLPVAVAIGRDKIIQTMKENLLVNNTLDAVFTLPAEIFYPGSAVQACCMVFTLGKPHFEGNEARTETFFGYYKEDGFKKKKNLGRIEQFDSKGKSKWKEIEKRWISLFRNKTVVPGMSAKKKVTGKDEWLCEAYMKTDYSKLKKEDFQQTVNDYLAYLMKGGKIHEF